MPERGLDYSAADRAVWTELFDAHTKDMQRCLSAELIAGFEALALSPDELPSCAQLSAKLRAATGWTTEAVAGLVPMRDFFRMLSQRVFPINVHIRSSEALGFSMIPDLFHEVGHCAMLMHPSFARFAHGLGLLARRYDSRASLSLCEKLYWFTAEVGLLASASSPRALGANFLSSRSERDNLRSGGASIARLEVLALDAAELDIFRVQPRYYVVDGLDELTGPCLRALERHIVGQRERCA